ncbi:DNA replication and repair protein RecF [Sphingomonas guangdongensis]|uniref:DNA replication and repair protein RecF n=1 Tax=Sphingomonas guangdongensis TaxID=1141890 RepID=A0A285R2D7_9SPHN|nr:DNA replication/repair protein RecF [Sphingomonas guangdongensis]SOB86527.1 DNA replication and repair protein RecF [Sphingomonas guangdongensis]
MLARLVLTDFRNHAAAGIDVAAPFVVLSGDNGAGKTNVLEAVSLLAPGRGLRRAALSDMARQGGAGGFGVAATLADAVQIGTGTRGDAPERRIVRVNGAAAAATSLAEWLSVLWLTPAMDRLFTAPGSERRRFLDRLTLAIAPAHAHHSARYEAAMRQRNRLLAEAANDRDWLGALETAMAEHGAAIQAARADLVAALAVALAEAPGGFARATVAIDGGEEADLARALADGRRRDATAGRTLVGPHRADLLVTNQAKGQAASLSSTGEQKALLFGIVLAHARLVAARTGRAPVLLLDEVAAHLDPVRRAALFAALAGVGQVWMTGTERALFADLPAGAARFTVDAGEIIPD